MKTGGSQKRSRKHGRMLGKPAFKRYWTAIYAKGNVVYQHRLEYNKVKSLMKTGSFEDVKQAIKYWRSVRKRHNKKSG